MNGNPNRSGGVDSDFFVAPFCRNDAGFAHILYYCDIFEQKPHNSAFFTANCAHRRAISSSRRTATGQTVQTRIFGQKLRNSALFRSFPRFSLQIMRIGGRNLRPAAQPQGRRRKRGIFGQNRAFPRFFALFRVFSYFPAFFATNCARRRAHPPSRRTAARRTARTRIFPGKTAQFRVFSLFSAHYADSPVQNVLFRTFYRSTGRHQFLRIID